MSSDERLARHLFCQAPKEELFSATEPVNEKSSNCQDQFGMCSPPFHLRMETDPVPKKLYFFLEYEKIDKFRILGILKVIYSSRIDGQLQIQAINKRFQLRYTSTNFKAYVSVVLRVVLTSSHKQSLSFQIKTVCMHTVTIKVQFTSGKSINQQLSCIVKANS